MASDLELHMVAAGHGTLGDVTEVERRRFHEHMHGIGGYVHSVYDIWSGVDSASDQASRTLNALARVMRRALEDHHQPDDCEDDCWAHEARRLLEELDD